MQMGLVAELIANGGMLPQLLELGKKSKIFTRRNGLIFSLMWFILFVPFGAAMWGILDVEELAAMSAVFGVFSSILLFLGSLFFLGKTPKEQPYIQNQQAAPATLQGNVMNQNALPPQQAQTAQEYVAPAAGAWKAPDTGELARPGSVIEGTTKLLQKDD
jgi:hypothetical protein